ncbi:MAG: hypothetical protein IKH76_04290 [Clostridiales bacterium]|nr:hypothetical protein [Clostridiales bacterium]
MQTSVKLQDMMSYSLILTIIAIAVIVLPIIIFIILKLIKFKPKNKPAKPAPVVKVQKTYDPVSLKSLYLNKIREIEVRYNEGKIDNRGAHQELSKAVRDYCSEASQIPTDKLTLQEIGRLNLPTLYSLIMEFYEPEFAYESAKDMNTSFNGAREVITLWN